MGVNQKQNTACVLLFLCFVAVFLVGFRYGTTNTEELNDKLQEAVTVMQQRDVTYSLEEAIEDGYYYEDDIKATNPTPFWMIRFLSAAGTLSSTEFKSVTTGDGVLYLNHVIYEPHEYTVAQFCIDSVLQRKTYAVDTYEYMIVFTNKEEQIFEYYLTNDETLLSKGRFGTLTKEDIEAGEVWYLLSRYYGSTE